MSRIEALIAELCLEGVEYKPLKYIVRIRNGKDYRGLGRGNVPVYGTGGIMTRVDVAAYFKPSVLIPRKGSLNKLYYVEEPFWTVDTIFYTEIDDSLVVPKFLYYFLVTQRLEELNQAGGVPSLTQSVLNEIRIPIPPLEVQRAIVKVLDTFTALEAELEAELEARRRQYQHYRNSLFSFEEDADVRWATLGEVGEFRRGTAITEKGITDGEIPVVANGPVPIYYHGESNRCGETIVIARSGAYSGLVSFWNQPIFLTDAFSVHPDTQLLKPRFVYYYLRNVQERIHAMKKGSGVPHVRIKDFESFNIPIPPLAEQARIVAILDQFNALVNDLTSGLPAEITARRQQYAYYRDRLLTFQEKT